MIRHVMPSERIKIFAEKKNLQETSIHLSLRHFVLFFKFGQKLCFRKLPRKILKKDF